MTRKSERETLVRIRGAAGAEAAIEYAGRRKMNHALRVLVVELMLVGKTNFADVCAVRHLHDLLTGPGELSGSDAAQLLRDLGTAAVQLSVEGLKPFADD